MRIKPKMNYYFEEGYSRKFPFALKKDRTYKAVVATNQPDYKKEGKIFVGELLLKKGEYTKVRSHIRKINRRMR